MPGMQHRKLFKAQCALLAKAADGGRLAGKKLGAIIKVCCKSRSGTCKQDGREKKVGARQHKRASVAQKGRVACQKPKMMNVFCTGLQVLRSRLGAGFVR